MKFSYIFHHLLRISLAFAFDDLSHHKLATLLPVYHLATTYDANNAVDGNPLTCMRTDAIGQTSSDKTVWWKVDLGGIYRIYSINILFKSYPGFEFRQRGRFAGFSLYVSPDDDGLKSSSLCYKDGPQLPPLNFTTVCIKSGRFVTFYNERLDREIYPKEYETVSVFTELCEVIVKGCIEAGFYGSNCDNPCPTHCKNNDCHVQNGKCYECDPGWKGETCQIKCENGWYGENCSQQCVQNCINKSACNHVTGHCDLGCDVGWRGSVCEKECENGLYGEDCSQQCVGNCKNNSTCNHVTGHCDEGCDVGWKGFMCEKECENGWYGENCIQQCVGNCINKSACNHVTGHCDVECDAGWRGSMCEKECENGWYSEKCSQQCVGNCKNNSTCNHVTGRCDVGCDVGWAGSMCEKECESGWYGENCTQQCVGNCINNSTCNHVTGHCDVGCDVGWAGSMCEKECTSGYFGAECMENCSGNCINNIRCDHINGECSGGCKDGYIGKRCENYTANNDLQIENINQPLLWIIGFSASVVFNALFIASILIRHRKNSNHKSPDNADLPISLRPTSYARGEIASIETDHYLYVDLHSKEMCYQNMSLK